jgi:hypothetical protein
MFGIWHMQGHHIHMVCSGAQLLSDLNLTHLIMVITYICKDKKNDFYYVNNITVVLTNVLAPWAPLGSQLWDLKRIPLHIHFLNKVFHLL